MPPLILIYFKSFTFRDLVIKYQLQRALCCFYPCLFPQIAGKGAKFVCCFKCDRQQQVQTGKQLQTAFCCLSCLHGPALPLAVLQFQATDCTMHALVGSHAWCVSLSIFGALGNLHAALILIHKYGEVLATMYLKHACWGFL